MRSIRTLLIFLFLFSFCSIQAQDTNLRVLGKVFQRSEKGSPVILSGDTLLKIYSPYGAFTPEDRARSLSSRINEIVREDKFYPDSLTAIPVENDYYIMYRDRVLFVISKYDTIGSGITMKMVSDEMVKTLKDNLLARSQHLSFWSIMKNIGYTLLVLVFLLVIIRLLSWVFRRVFAYIEKNKQKLFKSIRINQYEFLTVEREYEVAVYILRALKIFLIIFFFLIALPVIFSIFPATEGITRKIISLVWGPLKGILLAVVNYIPKMVTIVIIYFLFRYLIRFIRFLSREVERKSLVLPGFYPEWSRPTYNIIRVLLYAFMFVVIFPYLPGSESPVFKGVSVFLGVLLSLGSSSLISNLMAGLVITYMRPYKVGDRIKIDDIVGTVMEKSLMITRIKTIKNEDVTIPNSKVLTGYSVNYTTPTETEGLIIHTTVTIGYDAPWRTVHELLIRAANETEGVSDYPRPFVLQTSLDDFFISYQINAYIKNASMILKIKSDLHQNIQDEFNRAGVEIMSPHYRSERDGNAPAIPDEWEIELPPPGNEPGKQNDLKDVDKDKTKPTA